MTVSVPAIDWRARCIAFFPYVFLSAAVFFAYSNIYTNSFLSDDENLIVHNQFLQSWTYVPSLFVTSLNAGNNLDSTYYRPLQLLIYTILVHWFGLSTFFFHLLNVALHALNACIVYKLGRKLGFQSVATFFGTALWALHPVQTEAITYISSTADELYAFFCLLGVSVLLPDFSPRRLAAALPFMVLGLLSKEAAVSFPLLAMSCLYLLNERRFELKTYFRLWPFVCIAGAYTILHYTFLSQGDAGPGAGTHSESYTVDYSNISTLPAYVKMILCPIHLHMGHELPFDQTIWHSDILCGMGLFMITAAYVLYGQSLPLRWGLCWFVAALAPSFFASSIFYEHWMYVPSAGLFLGLAQTIALSIDKLPHDISRVVKQGAMALACLTLCLAGTLTHDQNLVWRDPEIFYKNIFDQGEKAAKAHVNLGAIYIKEGEYARAAEQNQTAIQNSNDTLAAAQVNLAIAELMLPAGTYSDEEALAHLHRALDIDPHFYSAYIALALFYSHKNDPSEAAFYQAKADDIRKKFLTMPDPPSAPDPSALP